MKAWQITELGEPEQALELVDTELPEPGPGELSIAVDAAGLGLPDVLMCRGQYEYKPQLPFTPGQEVVGRVISAGEGVSFQAGDRVMGVTSFFNGQGGYAQECMSMTGMVYPAPEYMSDEHAAGFVIPWHTAWIALVNRAAAQAGETLLVLGAAGGSGSAAVQLGKALGLRVIAVAGGAGKAAYCGELGADEVIDHHADKVVETTNALTAGLGANIVFDPAGGELCAEVVSCTASEGRLLLVGFASGKWGRVPPHEVVIRNCSAMGVFVGAYSPEQRQAVHEELLALYKKQQLVPLVGRVDGFDALPRMLKEMAERRLRGKAIIKVK